MTIDSNYNIIFATKGIDIMNIKLLSKLINNKKDNLESNNLVLLRELPFYGIAGSICRVEEAPECYYKILYNQDGSINSCMIPVPKKKKKNLNLVINDYIEDIKKYLNIFNDKYIDYSNNGVKTILDNRKFYILFIITLLASISSIPFLFTTAWAGLVFSTISTLSLYIVLDLHKKDKEKVRECNELIKQYEELQKVLDDYEFGKSILNKSSDEVFLTETVKNNVSVFEKIDILSNDKYRKVA